MKAPMFLEDDEVRALTGWAQRAKQIEQLRRMGIPFWVNGRGAPVVAREYFVPRAANEPAAATWEPRRA